MRRGAKSTAGKKKLKEYFELHVGEIIPTETLKAVGNNDSEYARRVRDLRSDGMEIQTHKDDPTIPVNHYRFTGVVKKSNPPVCSARKAQEFFKRDGYRCKKCGSRAGEVDLHTGKIVRIQAGHRLGRRIRGKPSPKNIETQCETCNAGHNKAHLPDESADTTSLMHLVMGSSAHVKSELFRKLLPHVTKREAIDAFSEQFGVRADRRKKIADILGEDDAEGKAAYEATRPKKKTKT